MTLDNLNREEFIEQLDSGVIFTPNVDHVMKLRRGSQSIVRPIVLLIISFAIAKCC